jgi:hypothetical protein
LPSILTEILFLSDFYRSTIFSKCKLIGIEGAATRTASKSF